MERFAEGMATLKPTLFVNSFWPCPTSPELKFITCARGKHVQHDTTDIIASSVQPDIDGNTHTSDRNESIPYLNEIF